MKKSWTDGLEPELERQIRGDFTSSLVLRNRLKDLIKHKIAESHTNSLTKDGYDVPNWAFKQADQVGFERALKEVIDLIT